MPIRSQGRGLLAAGRPLRRRRRARRHASSVCADVDQGDGRRRPHQFPRALLRCCATRAWSAASDGSKMSKSKGNVVTPDEMIDKYGADALRLWELFMSPFDEATHWNEDGVAGTSRYLMRVWTMVRRYVEAGAPAGNPERRDHQAHAQDDPDGDRSHRAAALQYRARRDDGSAQLPRKAEAGGARPIRARDLHRDARRDGAAHHRGNLARARP